MKNKKYTTDQAYARMMQACSRRECCVQDIQKKLARMELPEGASETIINQLKEDRYIDEERFIRSFIRDKLRFNKWGRKKIEQALYQKGLPREAVNRQFMEVDEEELTGSLPAILEKKWRGITGKSLYEKRSKLIRYALGRGFAMKEISGCLEELLKNEESDGEWVDME